MKLYVDSLPITASEVIPGFGEDWAEYVKVSRQRKGLSDLSVQITLPTKGCDEEDVWIALSCSCVASTTAISAAINIRRYLAVCQFLHLQPFDVDYEVSQADEFMPGIASGYAAYLSILDVIDRVSSGGFPSPVVYAAPNHVSAGAMLEGL